MRLRVRVLLPLLALGVSCFLSGGARAEDSDSSSRRHHHHHRHHDERSADAPKDEAPSIANAAVAAPPPGTSSDGVYAVQDREGRTVFTNAGNISVDGKELSLTELPPLDSVDFAQATPEQLRLLNTHAEAARDELQASERCESLRLASRASFVSYVWREHRREVFVGLGLFMLGMLGLAWHSRFMRATMPLPPLAACVYLLYAAYADTDALESTISAGLNACTATLVEGSAGDARIVQKRLEQVAKLRNVIDGAYEQHRAAIDAVVEKYKL